MVKMEYCNVKLISLWLTVCPFLIAAMAQAQIRSESSFITDLLKNLRQQQQSCEFIDFTIWVNDSSIPAHKNILSAACPYFCALFTSEMSEAKSQGAHLDHLDYDLVCNIVDYFYSGKIDKDVNSIKDLIVAADYLQLTVLQKECERFILDHVHITLENCLSWLKFANVYNVTKVSMAAVHIVRQRFADVANCEEFLQLSAGEVIKLFQDKDINVENEDPVLKAGLAWMHHDMEARREEFSRILKNVHLEFCSSAYLNHVLNQETILIDKSAMVKDSLLGAAASKISPDLKQCPRTSFEQNEETLVVLLNTRKSRLDCNVWSTSGPVPSPWEKVKFIKELEFQDSHAICKNDSSIIFTGGRYRYTIDDYDDDAMTNCYMLKLPTKSFYKLTPMTIPRFSHGSAVVGDYLYVIGGAVNSEDGPTNSVEKMNLKTAEWTWVKPMLHKVFEPIVATAGMNIYVILSDNYRNHNAHDEYGQSVQCYDTVTCTWSFKTPVPKMGNTAGASAVSLRDCIYLVGGRGGLCAEYNTNTDTWRSLQKCRHSQSYGSSAVYKRNIILMSRHNDTIQCYDVAKNEWRESELKLPHVHNFNGAVVTDAANDLNEDKRN